jgi:hypothetical protein
VSRIAILRVIAVAAAVALPGQARAQGGDNFRIHLGPVGIKPRISLNSLGIDTNVQNASDNAERDLTMTLVPGVDSFLRIGRGVLTGKTSYELVYFQKNSAERSANLSQGASYVFPAARLKAHFEGEYAASSQRPNAEIDVRVRQVTKSAGLGASMSLGGRTSLDFSTTRQTTSLANQIFLGVDLDEALGHHTQTYAVSLRRELTPLTTFAVQTQLDHQRFPLSPVRNADSVLIMPSLEFKPHALISGSASVGVQRFRPLSKELKGFTGVVAAVKLNYIFRDWTKFGVGIDRDVTYSFLDASPYFIATGARLDITQNLIGHWDVVGGLGRQHMTYQLLPSEETLTSVSRQDRTVNYRVGVGFRVTQDARIGFNIDYDRRMSPLERRQYDGFRFGGTFTYAY